MSVTSAMYTGVSGLLNNGEAMNVIGNNISNVNTVGFKSGKTVFSDLLSQNVGNNSQIGKGVQMQAVQNVFTSGTTQSSENVTDLAIQGNSFFALGDPSIDTGAALTSDEAYLSRAGAFHVNSDFFLVNPDGYKVLDTAGDPIKFVNDGLPANIATNFSSITKVEPNGLITYLATDGITQNYYSGSGAVGVAVSAVNAALVDRIAVVSVPDPTALAKIGGSLYKGDAISIPQATAALGAPNGISEQVLSNTLEGSNVDMASEFVKMIVTQRAYSANSKTITTADQMTQEVLQMVR